MSRWRGSLIQVLVSLSLSGDLGLSSNQSWSTVGCTEASSTTTKPRIGSQGPNLWSACSSASSPTCWWTSSSTRACLESSWCSPSPTTSTSWLSLWWWTRARQKSWMLRGQSQEYSTLASAFSWGCLRLHSSSLPCLDQPSARISCTPGHSCVLSGQLSCTMYLIFSSTRRTTSWSWTRCLRSHKTCLDSTRSYSRSRQNVCLSSTSSLASSPY